MEKVGFLRCTEAALFGDPGQSREEREKGGGSFILYFSVPPGPQKEGGKERRGWDLEGSLGVDITLSESTSLP